MTESFQRRRNVWMCLGLAAVVGAIYWPVVGHEFINYDDPIYVTENRHVNAGLTLAGLQWALTRIAGEGTYWHPLTWVSHMVDCQLFGLKPGWHHLTNVLFHIANGLLVFWALRRLTGAYWRSGLVAALFALHPLQVDTVAWVAERKNVLSTFFGLLTVLAYARYARRPGRGRLVWVVGLFGLGLLAKPMLVTLPCVLLLLDYWPLRRMAPATFLGLVQEKVPMFGLAALSSMVTLLAHERLQSVASAGQLALPLRMAHALVSYVQYLGKVIWPSHLAVYYPHPRVWPAGAVGMAGVLLAGISVLALWWARRRPYLWVGWLWFLGTLVPVIGLVQVGSQSMADRFIYLPIIGLFLMLVWGLAGVGVVGRWWRAVLVCSAVAAVAGCAVVTWFQLKHWRNSETLFRHALAVTRDSAVAHYSLGIALVQQDRLSEGMAHLEQAVRLKPDYPEAHNNLGYALLQQGKVAEAIGHVEEAVRLKPEYAEAYCNLGMVLFQLGRVPEAVSRYEQASRLQPEHAQTHNNLGVALLQLRKLPEAIGHLERALRLEPEYARARNNLGMALVQLGEALAAQGKWAEAIPQYERALALKPDDVAAHESLGRALGRQGRFAEAVGEYEKALGLDAGLVSARNNLAWLLATCPEGAIRDGVRAVGLAEAAARQTEGKDAAVLDTLAAGQAEAGRYEDAVRTARAARVRAQAAGQEEWARGIQARLELYQAGRPYRNMPGEGER